MGEKHIAPAGESILEHKRGADCPCKPERVTKVTRRHSKQGHKTEVIWRHNPLKGE